jgi:hypothetical protein
VRINGLIVGIIGGIIGLVAAGLALGVGANAIANGWRDQEPVGVVWLGSAALALSVLGIVGGALAMAKPRLGATLMLIAGIGGFIEIPLLEALGPFFFFVISVFYFVAGPLLIIGAVLAFLGRAKRAPAAMPAPPAA